MNKSEDWRAVLKKWGWDVSANAAGGIAATLLFALMVTLASFFGPSNQWLYGEIHLWGGWVLVAVVVIAAAGGFFGARSLYRVRRSTSVGSVFGSAAIPRQSVPFQPDSLQSRAIRLLRLADGKWVDFSRLVKQLGVSSQQDLSQALRRLDAEGWIEGHEDNYIMHEGAQSYRLADAGLTYARAQGYKTSTEIEREQAAKK